MEKLQVILSELKVNNNCISTEINEIENLSNKVAKSIKAHQASILEIQNRIQDIVNLKEEEQNVFVKIKDQENEFYIAMEKLEILQSEYENLSGFDEYEFGAVQNLADLEYQMKIFGIAIETQFLEPTITQAKILFSDEKFVILNYDLIENVFDLQEIKPTHIHFPEIRLFLLESGDIEGFLSCMRNFFRENK